MTQIPPSGKKLNLPLNPLRDMIRYKHDGTEYRLPTGMYYMIAIMCN